MRDFALRSTGSSFFHTRKTKKKTRLKEDPASPCRTPIEKRVPRHRRKNSTRSFMEHDHGQEHILLHVMGSNDDFHTFQKHSTIKQMTAELVVTKT